MCLDPASLGALALTAAGSVVNGMESNATAANQINARNAATKAELDRQHGYQATSGEQFNSALDKFSPTNQANARAGATGSLADLYGRNAITPGMVGSITTGAAPAVANANAGAKVADAFGRVANDASTLANVTGYGQAMNANSRALNDAGLGLDTTSNFARNSARVGGQEANAAYNNAYRSNSGLGDILGLAGTLVGMKPTGISTLFAKPAATGAPISLLPG